MMRVLAQGALLLLLLGVAGTPASAQEKRGSSNAPQPVTRKDPALHQKALQPRPLTLGESLGILGAALDSRHHADFSSDCSHFVHELYERAGFPYEYASSSDLYAGIGEFRRVTNPQPGDLVVWRGHAGIVVNPVQHSFFSVLRSGPGVDSYDAPYWKGRGRPRFFRYVKPGQGGVLSKSIPSASLQPAVLGNTPHEPDTEGPTSDVADESQERSNPSVLSNLAQNQTANTAPRVALVNSVRPSPAQVSAAFLQTCAKWEEGLRWRDFFSPAQSLIVFDHFEVKKVHIKGSQGWAEVQVDQLVTFTGSKADVHKRSERQRWLLSRRDGKSWELIPARNTIYLRQQIAERILAHELAQLTEDSSNAANKTPEKAELARLLSVLLER